MSFKAKSYRSSYRTNIRPKLPSDAIKNLDSFHKNVNLNSEEMLSTEEILSSEEMLSTEEILRSEEVLNLEEKLDEGTNLENQARENQISNEFNNFFDSSQNLSIENDENFVCQNESEQIPSNNNKDFNNHQEINSE